jgi:hypothetical protein
MPDKNTSATATTLTLDETHLLGRGEQAIRNNQRNMNWTVERSCSLFQFKDFSVAAAGGADFGCEEFLEGNAFG